METLLMNHLIPKENMLTPGDFKRKYQFKSKRKGDRIGFIIAIAVSAIALLILWYFG